MEFIQKSPIIIAIWLVAAVLLPVVSSAMVRRERASGEKMGERAMEVVVVGGRRRASNRSSNVAEQRLWLEATSPPPFTAREVGRLAGWLAPAALPLSSAVVLVLFYPCYLRRVVCLMMGGFFGRQHSSFDMHNQSRTHTQIDR